MQKRAQKIHEVFGRRFGISYAVKANPNLDLLRALDPHIHGLDVSSGGELKLALEAGYAPSRLSFTGPGKSLPELREAVRLGCGEIVVESMDELADVQNITQEFDRVARVLLRISPRSMPKGFGVNMAGRPSQFGIDEEHLDEALQTLSSMKSIHLAGFHIYAGAQCLNAESIVENFLNYMRIFREFAQRHKLQPEILVFGGGIGIPYHEGENAVDLDYVAEQINPALDALLGLPEFQRATLLLEIGRYLVGEAGYFLTSVRRIKHSRGRHMAICDGGLNNHLAACGHFGTIIHRNYMISRLPTQASLEPATELQEFDVFGPLCTTIDQLARQLRLSDLACGDVLAIHHSGAYGFTASPMMFISHRWAKEVIAERKGDGYALRVNKLFED
jgi:diaminopimelate decarboxylase